MADQEARRKANIPRPCRQEPIKGLDPYHRFVKEANETGSFRVPRSSPVEGHNKTGSSESNTLSSTTSRSTELKSMPSRSKLALNNGWRTPNLSASGWTPRQTPKQTPWSTPGMSRPTTAGTPNLEKHMEKGVDTPLPWRPFYLQRRIMLSFAVLFAGLIVTIEAILDQSNRNGGLGMSNGGYRYLWQYGPTLVFTIVAAMWSRVEYQAKSSAAWLRMSNGPADAERTLMLDYITMFQPKAAVKAIRNRDWLVAGATVVGLHFRILIVIATALITLSLTDAVDMSAKMALQMEFVNDNSDLANTGSLAFFTMAGLLTSNLSFPDGASTEFAYQPFSANMPAAAELHATVDGFAGWLDCEEAQFSFTALQPAQGNTQMSATLSTSSCTATQQVPVNSTLATTSKSVDVLAFQQASCDNSTDLDQQRIAVMAATIDIAPSSSGNVVTNNDAISGSASQATALLCKPNYSISTVNVVKNGTTLLEIGLAANPANRTLSNVDPWNIAQSHFDAYNAEAASGTAVYPDAATFYGAEAAVDIDPPMMAAILMRMNEQGSLPSLDDLQNSDTLTDLASAYYQQYSALLARSSLMQTTSATTSGTAILDGQRLVVRPFPAQVLVGFLAANLVFAIAAVFMVPKTGFLPRDPSTIIGQATLVAHSRQLLQCLRGMGSASSDDIREKLADSRYSVGIEEYERSVWSGSGSGSGSGSRQGYFRIFGGNPPPQDLPPSFVRTANFGQPPPIHAVARMSAIFVMALMIGGLEVVLRISDQNNGLANVGDDTYLHFLWTAGPALLLVLLAMYFGAADCVVRCLAPFLTLKQGGTFERTVGLDFMDRGPPQIVYRAFKTGNLAVVVTTATVFISSLLAVFSGTLYTAVTMPSTSSIVLQSKDFFGDSTATSPTDPICATCANDTIAASLILNANMSYPAFTFEDLNLPAFELIDAANNLSRSIAVQVPIRVPAVRSSMVCTIYDPSQISTNLTLHNYVLDGLVNPLRINIAAEPCVQDNERFGSNAVIGTAGSGSVTESSTRIDANAFFGAGTTLSDNPAQCSQLLYVWGQLSNANSSQTKVTHVFAMGCNETLETVDTDVMFQGADLRIDPGQPPRPDEGTARNNTIATPSIQYGALANITTPNILDGFFASLVTGQYAIPPTLLGGSKSQQDVSSAIQFQHKIIRAQSINFRARRHLTSQGSFPLDEAGNTIANGANFTSQASSSQPVLLSSVRALDPTQPRRLIQDTISTRILQSLLSATAALCIAAWLLSPNTKGLLPRNPCSIASVAAMLADGNVFGFLGRGAEWMTPDEIEMSFRDGSLKMLFKMGWEKVRRRRREEDRGLWGVGAGRNEERAFSISVVRTGGWGGGEDAGLGIMARVGMAQRGFVRGWGPE